jgi:glutamate synthase (NADPH) large chain
MLEKRDDLNHWKYKNIDLSKLLYREDTEGIAQFKQEEQDHGISDVLDWQLIEAAQPALKNRAEVYKEFSINNLNRSVGNMTSNEISKIYKGEGLPYGTIHYKFTGTAGQSFGAFSTKGLKLELEGDANDYFGKGLCGAELVVYPSKKATFKPENNMIIGNVAFYGATSGEAYINGLAGERFCVRNSGAKVVVEGVGDHGLEYMTGGMAIILGETGRNFAAGMSGGTAFVYDTKQSFASKVNKEMVELESPDNEDIDMLRAFIQKHKDVTGSSVADAILGNWNEAIKHFIKVYPTDYKRVIQERKKKAAEEVKEKVLA